MALGFQSPCLLSSCSSWRALNQSAAWSAPTESGFPVPGGLRGVTSLRHLPLPAPPRSRQSCPAARAPSAPTPRRVRSAAASNLLPRFGSFSPSPASLSRRCSFHQPLQATDGRHLACHLWPLASAELGRRGGREPEVLCRWVGLARSHWGFCFSFSRHLDAYC